VIVLAICQLHGSVDDEAPHLARETHTAIYDARLKLAQPTPIIALRTTVRSDAEALRASLGQRGHEVVLCDEEAVTTPSPLRAFRFGEHAFESDAADIAYDDIVVLVRASRTLHTETTKRVTERKLRPVAAIVTGGLILSKKVTQEEKRATHDREDLLYVFSRDGTAGLVSERGTIYASLPNVAPTQRENFMRVVSELRSRAPHTAFDERLLGHRTLEDHEIDLRAYVLFVAAQMR
jgi:hypothetical protein